MKQPSTLKVMGSAGSTRTRAAMRHWAASMALSREKGERSMAPQEARRWTLKEIERLERVPLARRLAVGSTYEVLYKALARSPEQPAHCFLPLGDSSQPGEALTARAFLDKVHQSANLLADLGMGPQDAMALLLPDLLEKALLLWGGQAAGIACPIPPSLPASQIVELLQAVRAKVLVTPAPEIDHELWQKTVQVRRQVKSIALILQVRGPGEEREAAYAFNALVEEYPADLLHTGRQIALDDLAVTLPLTHGLRTECDW